MMSEKMLLNPIASQKKEYLLSPEPRYPIYTPRMLQAIDNYYLLAGLL